ncbi:MAG TPA: NusG domain II-containing protein [Ignavibacteria bacterium]|nr:NusG domain II-containing protein [Ignavibacteria bacterium]HMR41401.1 NusG domain II-containing protein [Ignavibacteria bacterium]
MNRREFLKISALSVSAATLTGMTFGGVKELYAETEAGPGSFTLEIITDNPGKALNLSQLFFENNSFNNGVIKFSEFKINGEMPGDIVFVRNKDLINYKTGSDDVSADIRNIAGALDLPKQIVNPTRMRFQLSGKDSKAGNFLVFHKNNLVKTFSAGNSSMEIILNGTKGNLLLNINNGNASVISADCVHKTCVNTGTISRSGESIVCIPNELMILCE